MYKPAKTIFAVEIIKEKTGSDKFLYSFINNDSETESGELTAAEDFSGQIGLIYCILPPEAVSFKIFNFPFKLKNRKQILSLIVPALEEQNPLSVEDLSITFTKLDENSVLVEYIRKDKLSKISAELDNLIGGKIKIKYLSPYSLMYKIAAAANPGGDAAGNEKDYAAVLGFNGYSYGIFFEYGNLKDIANLNFPFNEGLLKSPDYADTRIIYQEGDLKYRLIGKGAIKKSDLPGYFTAAGADGSAKKGVLDRAAFYYKNIFVFCLIFLVLTIAATVWQVQGLDIKYAEKTALLNKTDSILRQYMPGKKVFYEPRFEIKSYYDSMKKRSISGNAGMGFLDMFNYISAAKSTINGISAGKIDYSLGRFTVTGTAPDYKSLNKLEKYLKKRYSDINVANSVKTPEAVSFIIYLKNK